MSAIAVADGGVRDCFCSAGYARHVDETNETSPGLGKYNTSLVCIPCDEAVSPTPATHAIWTVLQAGEIDGRSI